MTDRRSECDGCYWDTPFSECNHGTAWREQHRAGKVVKCRYRCSDRDTPTYIDGQGSLFVGLDGPGRIVVTVGDTGTAITRDQAYELSDILVRLANRYSSSEVEL